MRLTKSEIARGAVVAATLLSAAPVRGDEAPVHLRILEGGVLYGSLRESPAGGMLLLTHQGQEQPIAECADQDRAQAAAPAGSAVASVYVRNCGATVDFATHVALELGKDRRLVAVFEGRPNVELVWRGGQRLQVLHSPLRRASIFLRDTEALRMDVSYSAVGQLVPTSDVNTLDFSNYNYGATGRAAGVPAELLLRMAGWAQEASGLYGSDWGKWSGPPPYGDDPRGRAKVTDGIRYFEGGQWKR